MRAASPPEGLHHPEGLRGTHQPSSMAEVLGQRTLVGLGVVLVWLLLFHLLVNIWLLCVFTSLLVVLGGWLGSQALLESSSVVHLERFIGLEQVPPSVEDEQRLNQEIHNTVRKIIRDFVSSWFCTVSSERAFEQEVQEAMISMAMELKRRATLVDRKELTKRVLDLLGCHLQDYTRALEMLSQQQTAPAAKGASEGRQLWQAYSSMARPHPAACSEAVQLNHTRAAVHVMLHVLVPSAHLETRSGRLVVGELITCNVLLPFISKLADPDWLNCLVVDVFSKFRKPEEPITIERPSPVAPLASPPAQPEPVPPAETAPAPWGPAVPPLSARAVTFTGPDPPEPPAHDVMDSEDGVYPQNHVEEEQPTRFLLRPFMSGSKSNFFYQENDSDLDTPLADCKQGSIDSLVMLKREDGLHDRLNGTHLEGIGSSLRDSCCPKVRLSSQPAGTPQDCQLPAVGTAESARGLQNLDWQGAPPGVNPAKELLLGMEQSGLGSPGELGDDGLLQGPCPLPSFIFEPLSSPDGPAVIQNLRITGTITAQEHRGTGSHPYTLYTIKYETAMGCENPGSVQLACEDADLLAGYDNPSSVQQVAYHMVNRRYSEFLNLQTRLEEKPDLRKLIKGVKGPKKVFPDMPFGNMDSDRIEARKGLLEAFLKQLCTIAEVTSSEEMQEFLALNTDARIAFVKKPFIVSRIDKMVVTAIVDTLKTAFPRSEPQSPIEENEGEVDGGKVFSDKRSRSRLKFSSRNIPFMNCSDVRPPVLFSQEHNTTVFSGMSLGDLEAFILEQEELRSRDELETEDSPVTQRGLGLVDWRKLGQEPACETPLAEVLLNILCLLMKEQWSWLCTENIQRAIRLLFGTLINRWMDVSVANLTCTRYWVVYLQVIQEAVWPGGSLPKSPQNERSEQQKDGSKQQALHCLMRLLPDLVSDMLGSEKYRLSWQTLLDSFQDPHINRHLVYCILDLLLDFLVPEIPEEDFQRSLLQTLSRNPEKLLA